MISSGISMICRSDGAYRNFYCGSYKDLAPTKRACCLAKPAPKSDRYLDRPIGSPRPGSVLRRERFFGQVPHLPSPRFVGILASRRYPGVQDGRMKMLALAEWFMVTLAIGIVIGFPIWQWVSKML